MSGPESFRLVVRTVLPGLWLSRRSEMCNKSGRTTNRTEMEDHFRASLEPVLPLAEELGVHILIQPEPALLAENGSHVRGLLREPASRATGLNFDAGHYFCAGQDPDQAFQEMLEWIGHVHLEDIAPDRTHKHLIPGHGAIDFIALFNV